jgi:uncharacterized protein (DUF362 family)
MVNPHVLEYDTLISLAQHKVHNSATVTLTMKNIGLSYPAADYYGHPRMQYRHTHRFYDDLHGFIVGMFERFPAALGIITGHPAMVGQGPIGGRTFDTGLTIAGRDCVAVDTVGAYLLDEKNVPHIVRAGKRGLGNASLRQIEIVGLPINEALRIFKERSGVREAAGVT